MNSAIDLPNERCYRYKCVKRQALGADKYTGNFTYQGGPFRVKEILEKLEKLSTGRPLELIQKKAAGKKVIEYLRRLCP